MTDYKDFTIVVIRQNNGFSILKLTTKNGEFVTKQIKLSENFSIFNFANSQSNLPTVYTKKKKNPLQKILALFGII